MYLPYDSAISLLDILCRRKENLCLSKDLDKNVSNSFRNSSLKLETPVSVNRMDTQSVLWLHNGMVSNKKEWTSNTCNNTLVKKWEQCEILLSLYAQVSLAQVKGCWQKTQSLWVTDKGQVISHNNSTD